MKATAVASGVVGANSCELTGGSLPLTSPADRSHQRRPRAAPHPLPFIRTLRGNHHTPYSHQNASACEQVFFFTIYIRPSSRVGTSFAPRSRQKKNKNRRCSGWGGWDPRNSTAPPHSRTGTDSTFDPFAFENRQIKRLLTVAMSGVLASELWRLSRGSAARLLRSLCLLPPAAPLDQHGCSHHRR